MDDRKNTVVRLIADYLKSPSLRHVREPHNLHKLADDILRAVDQAGSIWTKWDGHRETVVMAAASCWIPEQDLLDYLNHLPGPPLTPTDVRQRLRALWESDFHEYPREEFKEGCVALYGREKDAGTEFIAIIGALQEHLEKEEDRERLRRDEARLRYIREERERMQGLYRVGADCGWIQMDDTKALYCRKNGRAYRIEPTKDKRWRLFRIPSPNSSGVILGTYQNRGEANKALKTIAYEEEPRW